MKPFFHPNDDSDLVVLTESRWFIADHKQQDKGYKTVKGILHSLLGLIAMASISSGVYL